MPRFTTPQQTLGCTACRLTSGSQRHFSFPVRASTAKTMLQFVMLYRVALCIKGVASWPPPPGPTSYDHARPNRLMLVVSICFSGLYLVSPGVSPYAGHSSPVLPAL